VADVKTHDPDRDSPLLSAPDLRVLGMGSHDITTARIIHRPLGVEGFLITYFHSAAMARLQGVEHHVPPSSLLIWEPGQRQYYGHAGGEWEYSWLHCTGAAVLDLLAKSSVPTQRIVPLDGDRECDQLFQSLRQECFYRPAPDPEVARQVLALWFTQVRRLLQAPAASRAIPAPWLAIKRYLDEHYADPITLEMLAERACLVPQYFCRMFKHYFELSAMEYLKRVRCEHARFLLRDHNLSIADVAHRVGYADYRHFSTLFLRHFGMRPTDMRKGMSGEAARARIAEERRGMELARWTREGWMLVSDHSVADATTFAREWAVSQRMNFGADAPVPHGEIAPVNYARDHVRITAPSSAVWTALRYTQDLGEEVKIAVRVLNSAPDGLNLAIAISGDVFTGYRLRISWYHHLVFETVRRQYWEPLYRCQTTLDPAADAYTFTLWRSNNVFYAEVDGQRIMTYHEPFAAYGPDHRSLGIGRFGDYGDAAIDRIHIWKRRTPRYVDILEPGRLLLRLGHHDEALDWFRRVADEHHEISTQHEAQYLAALAIPAAADTAKETALQRIITEANHPFRVRALCELALHRAARHDAAGTADVAEQLDRLSPDDGIYPYLAQQLLEYLRTADPAQHETILAHLARLPITELTIPVPLARLTAVRGARLSLLQAHAGDIADLAPLAGMALTRLYCGRNRLRDLTPLAGMPLYDCHVQENAITDLAPLAGMPLRTLHCGHNRIQDVTPLAGMPLRTLLCDHNLITDVTPLATLPLTMLLCDDNRIADLTPLASVPLRTLICSGNPLHDLSPLASCPLTVLECAATRVTALRGIAGLALTALNCSRTAVTDLGPVAAMPLTALNCAETPITDLTPLATVPLAELHIGRISLHAANAETLTALPLRELYCTLDDEMLALAQAHATLKSINGHERGHVCAVAPAALAAVRAWRADPHGAPAARQALRAFAVSIEERQVLALPLDLPREEAIAFCRWQGGCLVCPATEETYAQLRHYL